MREENFYIITGGPGGGKTTVLEKLSSMGYQVVPETARQIIKDRISRGLSPRPDEVAFAKEIFEKDFSNYNSNSHPSSPVFFDRSMLDSACMLYDADIHAYDQIRDIYQNNRYNSKVFLAPPWKEIYQNDTERDQSFSDAITVYNRLEKWYTDHSYQLIIFPKITVEERTGFILSHIR